MKAGISIKAVLAIIPILIGTLFFAGVMYDTYYYDSWGVDREQFPQSIQLYTVAGLLALFSTGATLVSGILKAAAYVSILTAVVSIFLYFYGRDIRDTFLFDWFGDTTDLENTPSKLSATFKIFLVVVAPFVLALIYAVIFLVLSLIILAAGSAGRKAAAHKMELFSKQIGSVEVVFSSESNISLKGEVYLIKCNEQRCAFYSDGKAIVIEKNMIVSVSSELPNSV